VSRPACASSVWFIVLVEAGLQRRVLLGKYKLMCFSAMISSLNVETLVLHFVSLKATRNICFTALLCECFLTLLLLVLKIKNDT